MIKKFKYVLSSGKLYRFPIVEGIKEVAYASRGDVYDTSVMEWVDDESTIHMVYDKSDVVEEKDVYNIIFDLNTEYTLSLENKEVRPKWESVDFSVMVGMKLDEADRYAKPYGCHIRVTSKPGENYWLTQDVREGRLNVELDGFNKVIKYDGMY